MTRYAALLRGVNVGGINMKMSEVREALSGNGFTGVQTVLASGNVLLDSSQSPDDIRQIMQRVLGDRFGYQAWVLVYSLSALGDIVDAFPWEPEVDGVHSYVVFCTEPPLLKELAALDDQLCGTRERLCLGGGVLYWQVPKSHTLDSAVAKYSAKQRFKSCTTTRNLRTLNKLLGG